MADFVGDRLIDRSQKTAILGAGLTGLTLGYLMSKKRTDLEILEKENECGGLVRSLSKGGFTFDYGGSHVIFSKDNEVLNFMLNLLGDNKVKNIRNTEVLYKDCYVKYPFENGLAGLPKEDNFECLYYFIRNIIEKEQGKLQKPRNLHEWCYFTFGKGIAEKYLIPYNEKIWKYPSTETSLRWVERIPNPPIEDIIKSSLGIETEGYTHQLSFYYPKTGGIQALGNHLKERIRGNITTDFEVKKLRKENAKWIVSNGREEKSYDKIVSTIPVQNLLRAMDVSQEIKNAGRNLKYNSLVSIMLGLSVPNVNNLSWLYIPDQNILPHRVSFPSNYSHFVVPEGKSSALAEVTCTKEDKIWKMADNALIERTIDDLHALKILKRKDICFAESRKTEFGYVIDDFDHEKNMTLIRNFMADVGIDLVGRFAEFEYMNMDDCIRRAMNYVEELRWHELSAR